MQGVFFEDYDPTVEDSFRKQVNVDDEPIFINVLDTAGQEEFRTFLERWIKEADAYLLIYSIVDKNSFLHEIPSFYNEIVRIKETSNFPLVLIGNKSDMENERTISLEDGQNLAKQYNCPFLETSALNNVNIEETFVKLIREIRESKKKEKKNDK